MITLFTDKNATPNNPSPAWMSLRGCRIVAVTEAEGSATIVSSIIKSMRDPATVFKSRGLRDNLVEWSPSAGPYICTNVKCKFTSVDGGIKRSAMVTKLLRLAERYVICHIFWGSYKRIGVLV